MPSVFADAFGSALTAGGVWNFVSSSFAPHRRAGPGGQVS
jgi:hypothetical protein